MSSAQTSNHVNIPLPRLGKIS
uniref:Uncharacterized protein n=1 Tax=Anguilla anguilla TaxID=7936 RepID=A0A0E9V5B3_ANGAN